MVGFDGQQVVGAVVLMDLTQGGLVGVQGVEHDELPIKGADPGEQLARGGK